MMGQVRGATGEVVCVEEREGIDQNRSNSRGYQQGEHGMACSMTAILYEGPRDRMLRIEDRRFSGSGTVSAAPWLGLNI
jgi:hypothetical protein